MEEDEKKPSAKTGRPTVYSKNMPQRAKKLCSRLGLTNEELAECFGVQVRTLLDWRDRHPEFDLALRQGRDVYDTNVAERSLMRRVTGYEFIETVKEPIVIRDDEGNAVGTELRVVKETTKQLPGDVTAQMFWLSNRNKERWRRVQAFEHTGRDGAPMETKVSVDDSVAAALANASTTALVKLREALTLIAQEEENIPDVQ